MSHKKCSTKIVHDTMKEFENKKLKLRNNTVVKDRKQAIAIALSQAENKCTYSSKEYKMLEIKVKEFLSFEIKDKIPLTRVIETRELIDYYYYGTVIKNGISEKEHILYFKRVSEQMQPVFEQLKLLNI